MNGPAAVLIGSRIGLEARANRYSDETSLFDAVVKELIKRKLDCILVDEAQFLTRDHVLQLCRISDELKIPVLCYGLRTDFQANLFPGSAALVGAGGCADRAEGGVRMRPQGDDEPPGRSGRPCGRCRRPDRDRRK